MSYCKKQKKKRIDSIKHRCLHSCLQKSCQRVACGLLPARRGALLSQPRSNLLRLLRLQINTRDSFDRLPITPFCRFGSVCGKELHYLIAHLPIAERTGCLHDLGAGKRPAGFLHRVPVRR